MFSKALRIAAALVGVWGMAWAQGAHAGDVAHARREARLNGAAMGLFDPRRLVVAARPGGRVIVSFSTPSGLHCEVQSVELDHDAVGAISARVDASYLGGGVNLEISSHGPVGRVHLHVKLEGVDKPVAVEVEDAPDYGPPKEFAVQAALVVGKED